MSVAQRPGTRHPIQAALTEWERAVLDDGPLHDEAFFAAFPGYATSHDEVIKGLSSVAVPLRVPGQPAAAIAVVCLDRSTDTAPVARRLRRAAEAVLGEFA